jgi:hypothetical protein
MWQAGALCNLAAYQPHFRSTIEHHTYEIRLRALSVSRRDLVRASPPARPMPLCWEPAQRALPISTDAAGVLPPARPRRVIDPGGAARAGARQRIRDNAAGLVDPDRLSAPVPPAAARCGLRRGRKARRRRALVCQQRRNPLLRRGQAVESLPAIGAGLVAVGDDAMSGSMGESART